MTSKLCTVLLALVIATAATACGTDELPAVEASTEADVTEVAESAEIEPVEVEPVEIEVEVTEPEPQPTDPENGNSHDSNPDDSASDDSDPDEDNAGDAMDEPRDEEPSLEPPVALEEVAQAIEGLDLADAETWARERGLSIRVVEADGVPFAVTQDYSTSRINVATTEGVVSSVDSLG